MKISTNWLKDFVTLKPPLESVAERLTLAGLEVKKVSPSQDGRDLIFEVEITTNRPDWLSHWGVAREIAAVENLPFKAPDIDKAVTRPAPSGWRVNLKELEGCPYYSAVYVEGLTPAPTPDFMRERLENCGLRSISLIVDITNYVLLETGQPLHAFDADLLQGKEIQIRRAKADESFTAIDGSQLKLSNKDLVIADAERPVALAGIMGGKETEMTDRTRNILLESAFFTPRWVRQTSLRYKISSDSSYRFERRVDPETVDFARERAITLIKKYANPRFISGVLRAGQVPQGGKAKIHLSLSEITKKLGIEIKPNQVSLFLSRLGLDVKVDSAGVVSVVVPSFRSDLTRPIDLIEEVARIYGFENIPETLPECLPIETEESLIWRLEEKARQVFAGFGLNEAVTFSLISEKGLDPAKDFVNAVSIVNPQNKELVWLRPTLCPSLLAVIENNVRWGVQGGGFFEIANVYSRSEGQSHPQESLTFGATVFGTWKAKNWLEAEREATFFDLKGMLESFLVSLGIADFSYQDGEKSFLIPNTARELVCRGEIIGVIGEVTQKVRNLSGLECQVFYAELSLSKILAFASWNKKVREMPRFPSVDRDLSVMVPDDLPAVRITEEILQMGVGLVRRVRLFDLFRGGRIPQGYKNLSFRVTYQAPDRTLVSEDVQQIHAEMGETIAQKFGAKFQA